MSGFAYEQHKGYSVVRFESHLPEMSWGDVEKEAGTVVQRMKEADVSRLLIDLSPMEMIQSGLIASLVRMWKATEGKKDRRVVVATPNEVVKDVIKSAGLLKLFTMVDTREEGAYELGVSKGAQLEQRERRVVAWVAFPAAILALLAMVPLVVGVTDTVQDNARYASSVLAVFSALAALFSLVKDNGWRRGLGGIALLISLGVLGIVYLDYAGKLDVVRTAIGLIDSPPTDGADESETNEPGAVPNPTESENTPSGDPPRGKRDAEDLNAEGRVEDGSPDSPLDSEPADETNNQPVLPSDEDAQINKVE